jgi:hypothetical protein
LDSESTGSATALVDAENPWGLERPKQPLLDGEIAEKVASAVRAEVPDAAIVRVTSDADGRAAYAARVELVCSPRLLEADCMSSFRPTREMAANRCSIFPSTPNE